MKLDKTTFGDTPAAMFLSTRLNEIRNPVLTRKISKCIIHYRCLMKDAKSAHDCRAISTTTLNWMMARMNDQLDDTAVEFHLPEKNHDAVTVDLMINVIRGEIKDIINKARKITNIERQQLVMGLTTRDRHVDIRNGNGDLLGYEVTRFTPKDVHLRHIPDLKTSRMLQIKSRDKLKKANKPNTLY